MPALDPADPLLRRATPADAPAIHALMTRAGEHLFATLGFANWIPAYPLERLREDCDPAHPFRTVWLAERAGAVVGTFTLATAPQYSYDETVHWRAAADDTIWLNRLAIEPAAQGGGLGTWCMRAAERLTRDAGRHAIHLDALRDNVPLATFYHRLGYQPRGLRCSGERVFTCYEKLLNA